MNASDRYGQLIVVVEILEALIRNIALKQALYRVDDDPPLNFWRLIYGNQMDVSVLDWCKLFGADDAERQPVHWKSVAADPDAFRTGLFAALGIDAATWSAYWEEMKKYRDMHRSRTMIRAESASLIIQNWIMRCIQHFTILITFEVNCGNSESINSLATFAYARAFEEKCVEVATAAMRATAGISE